MPPGIRSLVKHISGFCQNLKAEKTIFSIPPKKNRSSERASLKISQVKEYVSKNDLLQCMRIPFDRFFK